MRVTLGLLGETCTYGPTTQSLGRIISASLYKCSAMSFCFQFYAVAPVCYLSPTWLFPEPQIDGMQKPTPDKRRLRGKGTSNCPCQNSCLYFKLAIPYPGQRRGVWVITGGLTEDRGREGSESSEQRGYDSIQPQGPRSPKKSHLINPGFFVEVLIIYTASICQKLAKIGINKTYDLLYH